MRKPSLKERKGCCFNFLKSLSQNEGRPKDTQVSLPFCGLWLVTLSKWAGWGTCGIVFPLLLPLLFLCLLLQFGWSVITNNWFWFEEVANPVLKNNGNPSYHHEKPITFVIMLEKWSYGGYLIIHYYCTREWSQG